MHPQNDNDYLGPYIAIYRICCMEEKKANIFAKKNVESIHITGSDKTFDAIVFGTGEEGAKKEGKYAPSQVSWVV